MERTQEERLLAAVAHGSVMLTGIGVIVGALIYLQRRDKQPWLAGQGLQAAVYQLIGIGLIIASWLLWTACYTLSFIPLIALGTGEDSIWWVVGLGSMVLPILLMFVVWAYGLWGAFRAWQGADFRYVGIGRLVEGIDTTNTTNAEPDPA